MGAPDYHLTAGDIVGVGSADDRAFLQSVLQAASAARNDPTAIRPDGGFLPSRIQLWLSPDSGAAAEYDFSARGAGRSSAVEAAPRAVAARCLCVGMSDLVKLLGLMPLRLGGISLKPPSSPEPSPAPAEGEGRRPPSSTRRRWRRRARRRLKRAPWSPRPSASRSPRCRGWGS